MSRFEDINVGDIVTGRVSGLVPFGVFVKIADDADGLLPGATGFAVDEQIRVRVVELDRAQRRARLAEVS